MKNIFCILFFILFRQFVFAQEIALPKQNPIKPLWYAPSFVYNTDTLLYTTPKRIVTTIDSARIAKRKINYVLFYDFYTTLTAIQSMNSNAFEEKNNITAYYNINIKNNLEFRKLKWDLYLFNDFGKRWYLDTLFTVTTQDQFNFKNSIYYPIYKDKLYTSLTVNTKTRLFPNYNYRTNAQGANEKYLYETYMSPGFVYYSGGITYEPGKGINMQLGLGSSQITKIKNQEIFNTRNAQEINGLQKGQKSKSDFGLNFTANFPISQYGKHLYWENYANIFTPFTGIKAIHNYTFDVNNAFHFILLKYVRLSFRTKFGFNALMSEKPILVNQLSLGFYLSNQL